MWRKLYKTSIRQHVSFLTIAPLQAFVQVRRPSYARLTAAIHIVRRPQDARSAAAAPQPSDEKTAEFSSRRYGKRQKGLGNEKITKSPQDGIACTKTTVRQTLPDSLKTSPCGIACTKTTDWQVIPNRLTMSSGNIVCTKTTVRQKLYFTKPSK